MNTKIYTSVRYLQEKINQRHEAKLRNSSQSVGLCKYPPGLCVCGLNHKLWFLLLPGTLGPVTAPPRYDGSFAFIWPQRHGSWAVSSGSQDKLLMDRYSLVLRLWKRWNGLHFFEVAGFSCHPKLRFMGWQRVGHDWATELNWAGLSAELNRTELSNWTELKADISLCALSTPPKLSRVTYVSKDTKFHIYLRRLHSFPPRKYCFCSSLIQFRDCSLKMHLTPGSFLRFSLCYGSFL